MDRLAALSAEEVDAVMYANADELFRLDPSGRYPATTVRRWPGDGTAAAPTAALASSALDEDLLALAGVARVWLDGHSGSSVVRERLEAPTSDESLPGFWDDLVGLGWLGLAVDGSVGGQGRRLRGARRGAGGVGSGGRPGTVPLYGPRRHDPGRARPGAGRAPPVR